MQQAAILKPSYSTVDSTRCNNGFPAAHFAWDCRTLGYNRPLPPQWQDNCRIVQTITDPKLFCPCLRCAPNCFFVTCMPKLIGDDSI